MLLNEFSNCLETEHSGSRRSLTLLDQKADGKNAAPAMSYNGHHKRQLFEEVSCPLAPCGILRYQSYTNEEISSFPSQASHWLCA